MKTRPGDGAQPSPHEQPPRRRGCPSALRCAARTAAVLLWACGSPAPQEPRPNWLILAPDTLRADRVDPQSGAVAEAPVLSALAREGVIFTRMYTQASWTAPAVVSLLTGRYPQAGATDRSAEEWFPHQAQPLPSILRLYGYRTAAFWGDTLPAWFPAYSAGFDEVYTFPSPGRLSHDVVTWLEQGPPEPFFALVHDIDLHVVPPTGDDPGASWPMDIPGTGAGGDDVRRELLAWISAGYHGRLAVHDEAVGRILGALEAGGLTERTVVVLVSNHGEDMGEHWMLPDHGVLYDSVLHVPLVIRDPEDEGGPRAVDHPAQTIDLAPTVLERSGIPVARDMDGRSLLASLQPGALSAEDRPHFALGGRGNAALRSGGAKVILCSPPMCPGDHPCTASASPGRKMSQDLLFFDLAQDPGECDDRFEEATAEALPMAAQLLDWLAARQPEAGAKHATGTYSEEQRRVLQDRGYWGLIEGDAAEVGP
jgi:arylsulfatase A-like enzyme